ncbi:MAG: hypothetical protein AAGE37_10825 [Pseudomonadota bacterium]
MIAKIAAFLMVAVAVAVFPKRENREFSSEISEKFAMCRKIPHVLNIPKTDSTNRQFSMHLADICLLGKTDEPIKIFCGSFKLPISDFLTKTGD